MKFQEALRILIWLWYTAETVKSADMVLKMPNTTGRIPLTLPGIDVLSGLFNIGPFYQTEMRIALDTIHKSGILREYDISIDVFDTACNRNYGTTVFVRNISDYALDYNPKSFPLLLGPLCGDSEYVGKIVQFFNFVSIIPASEHTSVHNNKNMYRNVMVLLPSQRGFVYALPELLSANNWKNVMYISEQRSKNKDTSIFLEQCKIMNITVNTLETTLGERGMDEPLVALEKMIIEAKARSARIIVFNAISTVQLSCFLFKHGMYGPHYVFLHKSLMAFQSNTMLRFAVRGCTERGLYNVLGSVIFYGFNVNSNVDPLREDAFGWNTVKYEQRFLELYPGGQNHFGWWLYRTLYYDLIMFSALALNKTAETIAEDGWKLSDWTLGTENFQKNPRYINDIVLESYASIKHEGLWVTINKSSDWNAVRGITTFYQVQEFDGIQKPVAVYIHDAGKLTVGPGKPVWNTDDGMPPKDLMEIIEVEEPMLNQTVSIVLLSIGTLIFLFNTAIFAINIHNRRSSQNYIWLINCLLLFGNYCFIFASISLFAVTDSSSVHVNCMTTLSLVLVGMATVYSAAGLRFRIAYFHQRQFTSQFHVERSKGNVGVRSILGSSPYRSPYRTRRAIKSAKPTAQATQSVQAGKYILAAIIYNTIFITVIVAMLLVEPWGSEKGFQSLKVESVNLAYQPSKITCAMKPIQHFSPAGLSLLIISAVLAVFPIIMSTATAVMLRKAVPGKPATSVGHLKNVQMLSILLIVATIFAVFALSTQETGVLFILMITVGLIFNILFSAGLWTKL